MPPRKKNRDPFRRLVLAPRIVPASIPFCRCGDPGPRTVGSPGHDWDEDTKKYGRCLHKACGCKKFRPRAPRPEVA